MILYFIHGIIVIALFFGIFITCKKKDWGLFGAFSFFQIGFLLGFAIPFLFQKIVPNNFSYLVLFPYLYSFQYLLYLIAILILINIALKKKDQ
ncbi:hypothetical protein D3P07_22780 [Paenibacillus sp. 1011MAR3C5]|nr:hypothetical protein D3P07_22780 [Paenibacillus sp. 1011MAR3C5]